MASIIWMSVYTFLWIEILLTACLALPVPRSYRSKICRFCTRWDLKQRLQMPLIFVAVALTFCLVDGYSELQYILEKKANHRLHIEDDLHAQIIHDHEREYRVERNLYLSGFALTLLLAIGRLTELMQETTEMGDELELREEKRLQEIISERPVSASASTHKSKRIQ